mgnify:CR=1 FL=1
MELDMNQKLLDLIEQEKYEDAARLRDYMIKKEVKIII